MTDTPIYIGLEDGWSLELTNNNLTLRKTGTDESHIIPRDEVLSRIERLGLSLPKPLFHARIPELRKFQLGYAQARTFDEWLGSDFSVELHTHLKRYMRRSMFIGIAYILFNWPQWPYLILGGLLITQGALYRYHPSYWLFLLYASFWLGVALLSANHISNGQGSMPLQWILALMSIFFFFMSIGYFKKFRAIFNTA